MKTVFLRLLDETDKAKAMVEAIEKPSSGKRYDVDTGAFAQIDGSPFSYWISEAIRELFSRFPVFEGNGRMVRQGGVTGNDARFLRLAWEIEAEQPKEGKRWVPFAKGGAASPWYADYPVAVAWDDRRSTFSGYTGLLHRPSEKPSSADHYFSAGLTWPLRAARFMPVPLPRNSVFSIRGYAILAPEEKLLPLAAIGNSSLFDYVFKVALGRFGFPEFVVGILQKMPIPELSPAVELELSEAALRAWSLKRNLDTAEETSRAFTMPALLRSDAPSLDLAAKAWMDQIQATGEEISRIQRSIDDLCFDAYGIAESDRKVILETCSRPSADSDESENIDAEQEEVEVAPQGVDVTTLASNLLSWSIGVAFGRFDARLETRAQDLVDPKPFDALPACAPAVLGGATRAARGRMLVDDPGHADDISAASRAALESVLTDRAETWITDVTAVLGCKDLRSWIAKEFFDLHIKQYSRSRRRAPIYWQLGTPSGNYSIWLYVHTFSPDTLLRVQNDYVGLKLVDETRKLQDLKKEYAASTTKVQSTSIADQQETVDELQWMADEVRKTAELWRPDLSDGVLLCFAPLWRLTPQNKPWQKELKAAWDALCRGTYDWSHQAMHIWPERVIPKCAEDRSLAIAHGLEDVFWFEGEKGEWKPHENSAAVMAKLIRDRSSAGVKAALKNLLEAPIPVTGSKRNRKSKVA